MNKRRLMATVAIVLMVAVGGAWLVSSLLPQQSATGEALLKSEFDLIDHRGKTVSHEDLKGRWQLVFFGFTFCPDICPTALSNVTTVLEGLGEEADQITPLFITVDPERDTPRSWPTMSPTSIRGSSG